MKWFSGGQRKNLLHRHIASTSIYSETDFAALQNSLFFRQLAPYSPTALEASQTHTTLKSHLVPASTVQVRALGPDHHCGSKLKAVSWSVLEGDLSLLQTCISQPSTACAWSFHPLRQPMRFPDSHQSRAISKSGFELSLPKMIVQTQQSNRQTWGEALCNFPTQEAAYFSTKPGLLGQSWAAVLSESYAKSKLVRPKMIQLFSSLFVKQKLVKRPKQS